VTALVVARHLVIGTHIQITRTIETTHAQGRLVSVSPPRRLAGDRLVVRLEVLEPATPITTGNRLPAARSTAIARRSEPVYYPVRIPAAGAVSPQPRRRSRARLVAALAVVAVLGVLGAAVAQVVSLVMDAAAWIGAHGDVLAGTGLAVLVLGTLVAVPAARCCLDLARRGCGH
jgi:hypothetical protein